MDITKLPHDLYNGAKAAVDFTVDVGAKAVQAVPDTFNYLKSLF